MNVRPTVLLVALGGALALAPPAAAADAPSIVFNVGAASDYAFRGVSQTDEDPEVFGGADATLGKLYAGVWVSNVDFGDSTDFEFDLYAGVTPRLGPISLDLGVLYYGYGDQPHGAEYGYFEAKVAGSVPVGPARLGAAAYYSPDSFGTADQTLYYEVNGSYSVGDKLSFSGALGRQAIEGPGDYTTWNLGVGYAVTPHVSVDLRYHDTNAHRFGKIYDSRAVASLKATF